MSILFVLLTFLLIITVTYFRRPAEQPLSHALSPSLSPQVTSQTSQFEFPEQLRYHPGHTWVCDDGRQNTRVGMDAFAAQLFGTIEKIETVDLNRWVRQGQKLWTVVSGGRSVDMLSPIEGVLVSVNHRVVENPQSLAADPYRDGWICLVKAPEMETNFRNLLHGPMIAPWIQNTLSRLSDLMRAASPALALAQDGGLPVKGAITRMDEKTFQRVTSEMFLA